MSGSCLIQKETDNLYSLPISELENHDFMPELFDRNQLIYDFPGTFTISSLHGLSTALYVFYYTTAISVAH